VFKSICHYGSVSIAAAGVGALLFIRFDLPGANPAQSSVPEISPAAFSFSEIYPWVVAPGPLTSSSGAARLATAAGSAAGGNFGVAANGALQAVNQLGPLAFGLDSIRAFSASQPPPGSNTATGNYTQMDQWATGVPGLASSTGAMGFTDNAASWDPIIGTHAGVLQTANQVGPFFFNLNVLKAIGFTQAPGGGLLPLPNGLNDNFSAVDIGRWSAGIPGVITNTGTTGFVTSDNFTGGPPNGFRIGGLHTTTQVGPMTFDFNVLPSISTSLGPPSISFALAPDMTAAPTPFAQLTPPPPGVVLPMGGLPVPAAVVAPAPAPTAAVERSETVGDAAAQNSVDEAPAVTDEKPTTVIPGVNGAPLAKPPTTAASGSGGGNPFAPFTDAISNGIGAITGNRPAAPGTGSSGSPDTGDGPSPGSESGGDTGSEAG
jgi:hypothetical protein